LYEWWKARLIRQENEEINSIWSDKEYEEENEMLIRLIRIRHKLWT
jgi:hypothetical protein